jgi:hypothetical protein
MAEDDVERLRRLCEGKQRQGKDRESRQYTQLIKLNFETEVVHWGGGLHRGPAGLQRHPFILFAHDIEMDQLRIAQ